MRFSLNSAVRFDKYKTCTFFPSHRRDSYQNKSGGKRLKFMSVCLMKTNSYHYKYNVRFRKEMAHKERHKNMTYMYLYTASFSLCCNASFAKVLPVVCSFSRRLMVADLSSSALVYVFQDCKSSSNGSTCSMVCSRHQLQKKTGGTGVNIMYSFQHLN